MLHIVTGLMGHGKTLCTIAYIEKKFAGRDIYYFHIPELKLQHWVKMEDPKRWFELPDGAVIVIDEAHYYFPRRGNMKGGEPDYISRFTELRKPGFDVFLITQNAMNIDHFIRRLCNHHMHFFRPFNWILTVKTEWDHFCKDVRDIRLKKLSFSRKLMMFPKQYFGAYHSANSHDKKTRFPLKLASLPLLLLAFFGISSYVYSSVSGKDKVVVTDLSSSSVPVSTFPEISKSSVSNSVSSFVASVVPGSSIPPVVRLSGVADWGTGGVAIFEVDGEHRRLSLADAGCSYAFKRWKCSYEGVEYGL